MLTKSKSAPCLLETTLINYNLKLMKPKIYAMIPARFGSQRLRLKNLALIQGKPLIYYAIQAAKKTNCFDKIIINSDHKIFSHIAKRYKVGFYKRPKQLGSSNTQSDDIVNDFIFSC